MKWIFVALLAFAGTAHGQTVFKCKDTKGAVVYQSDPCATGPAEKRWDAAPGARYGSYSPDDQMTAFQAGREVESARAQVQANNARRAASASIGGAGGGAYRSQSPPSGAVRGSTCSVAKVARDNARAGFNGHLSFNAASSLDAMVRNSCK